ncbi:MAG: pyruvate kinase [Caldisphaeraceae archaeon]|nr:pyruvate kinase [Caldisphaeraceae archaeon]
MRLAKIIATVGPSVKDYNTIRRMIASGVDAFRINMSHGNVEEWDEFLNLINKACNDLGVIVSRIADLEGPRVRLGNFEAIKLTRGQTVVLRYENSKIDGIPVDNMAFFSSAEEGDRVLIDDGKVVLEVEEVEREAVTTRVIEGETLDPRKGVVIAGKEFDMSPITNKDLEDMKYIASRNFDYIMASFVRSANHINIIREALKKEGVSSPTILAKIETVTGVSNIDEISEAADGIVVARGDLGMHFPLEELPVIQRRIIRSARRKLKPVILATEIFMSMVERPVPSRGEISDVYRAIEQGVDGFLVTSETSIGRYPVQVISWLGKVIREAQKHTKPVEVLRQQEVESMDLVEIKIANGIIKLAESANAEILTYASSLEMPRLVSMFRPAKPVYTGTQSEEDARKLNILWGIKPLVIGQVTYEDEGLSATEIHLLKDGLIGPGDVVVEAARSRERNVFVIKIKEVL